MYFAKNENETRSIAGEIASNVNVGEVLCFYGDLGAGKTEFIKGFCNKLGIEEQVSSPSFSLVNRYYANCPYFIGDIYHIDLYRLKSTNELIDIGFNEYIYDLEAIKLVEWASNAEEYLPKERLNIKIDIDLDNISHRKIEIIRSSK